MRPYVTLKTCCNAEFTYLVVAKSFKCQQNNVMLVRWITNGILFYVSELLFSLLITFVSFCSMDTALIEYSISNTSNNNMNYKLMIYYKLVSRIIYRLYHTCILAETIIL